MGRERDIIVEREAEGYEKLFVISSNLYERKASHEYLSKGVWFGKAKGVGHPD